MRWNHPRRGLFLPGEFIPVFERNGFIYEMDKFVWNKACALLRRWIDEGLRPLPLSINISRYDLFCCDLTDVLKDLLKKYDLPADLLRLEIIETAFAQSTDRIISVVKRLIECGFMVEIDDFGSGYSSLNTLKDVPAQVLKLDMRFLENNENSTRGGNILESIVRLAKWLGMSVIAEGVELKEQADYLKSIGCSYVQGYLYAKPMRVEEYERLTAAVGKEERLLTLETVETLDNSAFWDPKSMDTLIFNSYVGGACIFEYHGGKLEMLRANEKYARMLGESVTVEETLQIRWEEHLDAEGCKKLNAAAQRAVDTGEEVVYEAVYDNLIAGQKKTWLRSTFWAIARAGSPSLIYCINENITLQREAGLQKAEAAERLSALNLKIESDNRTLLNLMNDAPGGFVRMRIQDDMTCVLDYANDSFCHMLGMTKDEASEQRNEGRS